MNSPSLNPEDPYKGQLQASSTRDDEIDLREVLGVLLAGRWLFLSILLGALGMGVGYIALAEPIYTADALVQVERQSQSSIDSAIGNMAEMLGGEVQIPGEVEILQSRMVLGRVVDELGLDTTAAPFYMPFIGEPYARVLHGNAQNPQPPPIGALGRYAWGGESIALGQATVPDSLLGREMFVITTAGGYELKSASGQLLLTGKIGELASADTRDGSINLFVKELHARPGTQFVILIKPRLKAIFDLRKNLTVAESSKGSGILMVTMRGKNPQRIADVVNHLVIAYQRQNVERKSAEAAQTLAFLEKQLPNLKLDVEAAEQAINQYRLKRGSADLAKETDLVLQRSVELETSRMALQQQREDALRRFTSNHPVIQTIDSQIATLREASDKVNSAVKTLPETQQELLRLNRDLQVSTQLYTTLLNNAQELQMVKAGTVGNVRIVDPSLPPIKPTEPNNSLVLLASALLGIFLGILAVFVRRALHAGVEDPAEIEKSLGLTVYASVPYSLDQRKIERAKERGKTGGVILAGVAPDNVAIEALRSLRTALHFGMVEAANNIVVLTGPEPQIGKSFVSVNLAAVLANTGKKVLIIDLDLRRGRLHEYVDGQRAPGFSDYFTGTPDVIRKTSIEGLDIITSGTLPPNPAELLMNAKTIELLKALSAQYDYVIIDTPPILAVTDAALVARLAGTTLLVLKAGQHPMRMIEESARRLQQGGVQLRGTIFNQVGAGGSYAYGYRYGYSYAYYNYKRADS